MVQYCTVAQVTRIARFNESVPLVDVPDALHVDVPDALADWRHDYWYWPDWYWPGYWRDHKQGIGGIINRWPETGNCP